MVSGKQVALEGTAEVAVYGTSGGRAMGELLSVPSVNDYRGSDGALPSNADSEVSSGNRSKLDRGLRARWILLGAKRPHRCRAAIFAAVRQLGAKRPIFPA